MIGVSFKYKIYLRNKIIDPENKLSSFSKRPTFSDFFPMEVQNMPEKEIKYRKRANLALVIFYASIIFEFLIVYFLKKM
jgi:hypothetical protein